MSANLRSSKIRKSCFSESSWSEAVKSARSDVELKYSASMWVFATQMRGPICDKSARMDAGDVWSRETQRLVRLRAIKARSVRPRGVRWVAAREEYVAVRGFDMVVEIRF